MQALGIKSFKSIGYKNCLDLTVDNKNHNFICEGTICSNSHSVSYAALAAITVYLKFNHPKEFFISLLKMSQHEQNTHDEIRIISGELKRFNIKLLPPDLGKSKLDFSIDGDNIRYGLSSIKGVSTKSFEALEKFRETNSPNKFQIFLAAKEAGLNIGVLSSLIQAGTLEDYKNKRPRTVLEAQVFNLLTDREKRNVVLLGEKYDFDLLNLIKDCVDNQIVGDDGRKLFPVKRFETLKKSIDKYKQIYAQNSKYESFANWYFETTLLGYSPNLRLKKIFGDDYRDSEDIADIPAGRKTKFVGTVATCKKGKSRNDNIYLTMEVVDENGKLRFMFCDNRAYTKCSDFLEGNAMPEKGDIVTILGSKSDDGRTIFVDELSVVSERIYMKLKDID